MAKAYQVIASKTFFQKNLLWMLAFLISVGLGLYFRTYLLHQSTTLQPQKVAAYFVKQALSKKFEKAIEVQNPNLSGDDKLKFAREQAEKMIQSDPVNYQKAVSEALTQIKGSIPKSSGRHYLLEADPYYYYYLTEQIIQHGKIAEKVKGGQYFHPLMHAPYGYWTALTWHPHVGFQIARVVRFVLPEIDWMEALCWVPLVLSVLACFCFLLLAKSMQVNVFSFFLGALSFMLAPIFLQRSGFGWYDTDPYNYIFPFLILALVMTGLKNSRWIRWCAVGSGFLTGLYGLFWTGWPFMFLLLPGALFMAQAIVCWIFKINSKTMSHFNRYLFIHVFASVFFAILFLTPQGVWRAIEAGWNILGQFSLSNKDIWPNIFLTVGEARGISFKKLIFLSGNYITFGLAVLGLLSAGLDAWRSRFHQPESLAKWIFLVLFSAPLFILPFKTERFGILFVIPLCIWVMLGVRTIDAYLFNFINRFRGANLFQKLAQSAGRALILTVFLPLPIVMAHLVSSGVKPIMDDAWFASMQNLREKTPPDAIMDSWWPPGYFIASLAQRRVIADGGTQHLREPYWIARILVSEDERESAGLLQMLNQSGNDALLFLKAFGVEISDAIELIISVVSLSRTEAMERLPKEMPERVKNQFLYLTHGRGFMPASYVMVYSDMVEQNLAVTMIARWNFKKARDAQLNKSAQGFLNRRTTSYVQDFMSMTDGVLKYSPAATLQKKNNNVLMFSNGLSVDLKNMDALINLPQKNIHGHPASLLYMKEGQLEEKTFSGDILDTSALLILDDNGSWSSVLADRRLIRSLMFRLYYLKGEGLKYFKPFSEHTDPISNNRVSVFELNQEPLKETASSLIEV